MMKALEKLRETLCEELDKVAKKSEMSAGDLEVTHKLTDTIKNIDKIMMLEDGEEGYSQDGGWMARGTYGDGNSYRGRKRDSMGRYSRADGRWMRTDRYSRADGKDAMMDKLEEMMQNASTERERQVIQRCMDEIERA